MQYHKSLIVLQLIVIVIVLIPSCNACSGRRKPAPKPKPQTKPTSTSSVISASTKFVTTTMNVPSSPSPSTSEQGSHFCVSTTTKNITNKSIEMRLDEFANSGNLSFLFENGEVLVPKIFLKLAAPNDTNCSNVEGYLIIINKTSNDTGKTSPYKYDIKKLEQKPASAQCEEYKKPNACLVLPSLKVSTTTATTSKTTVTTISAGTSTLQPDATEETLTDKTKAMSNGEIAQGTASPGRSSADGGVPSIVIAIPVTVALLLIAVAIFALWFKRRLSAGKGNRENEIQSSVDRVAGPVNGDVYTIVNPVAEKETKGKGDNNDVVYTELADMKLGKCEPDKRAEQSETEYADITHILTAGESTYENVTRQTDEKEAYANVAELSV